MEFAAAVVATAVRDTHTHTHFLAGFLWIVLADTPALPGNTLKFAEALALPGNKLTFAEALVTAYLLTRRVHVSSSAFPEVGEVNKGHASCTLAPII